MTAPVTPEHDVCCAWGCGTGACETCPCCCAGWCIGGRDGIPGTPECEPDADPEQVVYFWDVAAKHNPIAAELGRVRAQVDRLTADVQWWKDRDECERANWQAELDQLHAQVAEAWDEGWHEAGEQWLIGFTAAAEGRDLPPQGDGPPNPYRAALAASDEVQP